MPGPPSRSAKVVLRRELPALYAPKNRDWEPVEVPLLSYLMIDGTGDPNTAQAYAAAVETLFSTSYPVKFTSKRELGRDYVVSVLEGLWYADDPSVFAARDKSAFGWTMMIRQPDWVTEEMVTTAMAGASRKRPELPYDRLRLETLTEGRCLQVLHIGSYDDEAPLLRRLHDEVMPDQGLTFNGHHHEVYLGDPRRTDPERLRTVLRQPVRAPMSDSA